MSRALLTCALLGACSPQIRDHVPEEGFEVVQVDDLEMAYLEEGSGPLVVLLHGFPDTAHTWDHVRPDLADAGFRAVSPFLRGYAPTTVEGPDPDARRLGQDVLGLIEALGEDTAIVVGHDWGAQAAYAAAHLDPDRVDFLVTVAIPHPSAIPVTPPLLWGGRHFLYLARPTAVKLMQRDDFHHVDELYGRWAPTWDVPADELEPAKNAFAFPGSVNGALGYYRAAETGVPAFMDGPIEVPALLVGGTDDGVLAPEVFEDSRSAYADDIQVEILPGGHFVHRESPDAFRTLLLDAVLANAP